jgi:hypothetical protein
MEKSRLRPDFSFIDDAGEVILWEHLGRMDRASYREGWAWKKNWYSLNGFTAERQSPWAWCYAQAADDNARRSRW